MQSLWGPGASEKQEADWALAPPCARRLVGDCVPGARAGGGSQGPGWGALEEGEVCVLEVPFSPEGNTAGLLYDCRGWEGEPPTPIVEGGSSEFAERLSGTPHSPSSFGHFLPFRY